MTDNVSVWNRPFLRLFVSPDPLTTAVDEALSLIPLHLERVVRDSFGLQPDPRLEDISPGSLQEAIEFLSRSDISESLREFLNV